LEPLSFCGQRLTGAGEGSARFEAKQKSIAKAALPAKIKRDKAGRTP
jgi:hypothetical protein